MLPAADRAILQQNNDLPLDLKEARHAMAIARAAGAQTYAADTMRKADNDLRNAEAFWQSTKDKKRVQTLARKVAQLAEDARVRKREAEQIGRRAATGRAIDRAGESGYRAGGPPAR